MARLVRGVVIALIVIHGLIHLPGAVKGLGWASVPQLSAPISTTSGVAWLLAGLLVIAAGVLVAIDRPSWWWAVVLVAALSSEAVILTAWDDAKAGTLANVILLLAALYGFASRGPGSPRATWQQRAGQALSDVRDQQEGVLTEADLSGLPTPLAQYVRQSGAVGRPRVVNFHAVVRGQIRGGPNKPWMPFTGRQVNTYQATPQRLLLMNATRLGLPITMTHLFDTSGATMRGKLLSLIPVVDSKGPDMDRAETVTVFNDLVVLAPGAIPFAQVQWTGVDEHHVIGVFRRRDQTVTAELAFNDDSELVDFVSDDRLRASPDGKSFTAMRWNTPISRYRQLHDRKVAVLGQGQWHAPEPEGHFTYLTFEVHNLEYNVDGLDR